jgi:hypothetical protein
MTQASEDASMALVMAETYLIEMLKADDAEDFALYTKRYEKERLVGFTLERFKNDLKHMHQDNGMNLGYEFLASLRNQIVKGTSVYRSVWKGVYEKRDAVIELGIYQKEGAWYLMRSAVY